MMIAVQAAKDKLRYEKEAAVYTPPAGMEKPTKKGKANNPSKAKPKAKKDPNAPKRGKSSFMFYSTEMRAKIKEENPDLSFGDLGRKLGEMFKALSPEEKAKYEKKAAGAKKKYEEEMKSYNATIKAEKEVEDDSDGVEEDVEDDDGSDDSE